MDEPRPPASQRSEPSPPVPKRSTKLISKYDPIAPRRAKPPPRQKPVKPSKSSSKPRKDLTDTCRLCLADISEECLLSCNRHTCSKCCVSLGCGCTFPAHKNAFSRFDAKNAKRSARDKEEDNVVIQSDAKRQQLQRATCSSAACEESIAQTAWQKCSHKSCKQCCWAAGPGCTYPPHVNSSPKKPQADDEPTAYKRRRLDKVPCSSAGCGALIAATVYNECIKQSCGPCCAASGAACLYPAHVKAHELQNGAGPSTPSDRPCCASEGCATLVAVSANALCFRKTCALCCAAAGGGCLYPAHRRALNNLNAARPPAVPADAPCDRGGELHVPADGPSVSGALPQTRAYVAPTPAKQAPANPELLPCSFCAREVKAYAHRRCPSHACRECCALQKTQCVHHHRGPNGENLDVAKSCSTAGCQHTVPRSVQRDCSSCSACCKAADAPCKYHKKEEYEALKLRDVADGDYPCGRKGCFKSISPASAKCCKVCTDCCHKRKAKCKYHKPSTCRQDKMDDLLAGVPRLMRVNREIAERTQMALRRVYGHDSDDSSSEDEDAAPPDRRADLVRARVRAEAGLQLAREKTASMRTMMAASFAVHVATAATAGEHLVNVARELEEERATTFRTTMAAIFAVNVATAVDATVLHTTEGVDACIAAALCAYKEELARTEAELLADGSPQASDARAARAEYGLQARWWPLLDGAAGILAGSQKKRLQAVTHMRCCGSCGHTEFDKGSSPHFKEVSDADRGAPPYAQCNAVLLRNMRPQPGMWWQCRNCENLATRMQRQQWSVPMPKDYANLLIVPGHKCLALQNLSLMDVRVRMAAHNIGFANGQIGTGTCLSSPFMVYLPKQAPLPEVDEDAMDPAAAAAAHAATAAAAAEEVEADRVALAGRVACVLDYNLRAHNPFYAGFLCMAERDNPEHGYPAIDVSALRKSIQSARDRGPRPTDAMGRDKHLEGTVGLALDVHHRCTQSEDQDAVFDVGRLHARADALTAATEQRADAGTPLHVNRDGTQPQLLQNLRPQYRNHAHLMAQFARSVVRTADGLAMTCETAMFPFLFPDGKGAFCKGIGKDYTTISTYLGFRMSCMFSVWTLYKPYLLVMYQLRQAVVTANSISAVALESDMAYYAKSHPGASMQDILKHITRYKIPGTVAGSPSWFRDKLSDLLTLVEEWGMPALFLTLTADEFSSTRWPEVKAMEDMAKSMNVELDWKDLPVECARLFVARTESFLNDYVLCTAFHGADGPGGMFGKVLHHMVRYEVQARGSLHAHIMLWVSEEDRKIAGDEIAACHPGIWDEHDRKWVVPDAFRGSEAYKVQADHVARKQQHQCSKVHEPGCRMKSNQCKYCFPQDKQLDTRATWSNVTKRYQYYRPLGGVDGQDRNTTPTHCVANVLWGAHTNLQLVSVDSWSHYVLKYQLKAEPEGELNLDAEHAKALGLGGLTTMQLKLIAANVLTRYVSAAEAALHVLGIPIVRMSSTVMSVSTQTPEKRTKLFLRQGKTTLAPVTKYELRPQALHHVTLPDFFRGYVMRAPGSPVADGNTAVGLSRCGTFCVDQLKDRVLVRFTDAHPAFAPETFFYNYLLSKKAFTSELDLLSETNPDGCYYTQCIMDGYIKDEDELVAAVQSYTRRHLLSRAKFAGSVEKLIGMRDPCVPVVPKDPSAAPLPKCTSKKKPTPEALLSEFAAYHAPGYNLTQEQQQVMDSIDRQPHGLHVIGGGGGSGKSELVKYLTHHFRLKGKSVLLTATTGAAAQRLSPHARTVHSQLGIGPHSVYLPALHPLGEVRATLLGCNVLIIDEYSMLTKPFWDLIMTRLITTSGAGPRTIQELLSSMLIILVGDHLQLPAVCNCKSRSRHTKDAEEYDDDDDEDEADYCTFCDVTTCSLFQAATKHDLAKSVRQKGDDLFRSFLAYVRRTRPTQKQIDDVITPDMYVCRDKLLAMVTKDDTILCSHVRDVLDYNGAILRKVFTPEQIVRVPLRHREEMHKERQGHRARPYPEEVHEWLSDRRFHTLDEAAIHARVIITDNLSIAGCVNGSTGTIKEFCYKNGEMFKIMVKLDLTGSLVGILRTEDKRFSKDLRTFVKTTFPLSLSYAMTGHKAQGATLSTRTFVDMRSAFVPALLYVMLSRVTLRCLLRIVVTKEGDKLLPSLFKPARAVAGLS